MRDTHAKRIGDLVSFYQDTGIEEIYGVGFAEALKVTNCVDVLVSNKRIYGGYEDCVDVVRVDNIVLENSILTAETPTRVHVTAKGGGAKHVYRNLILKGDPIWWEFSLGDWTLYNADPKFKPMGEVVIDSVRRLDGKKFNVLQLYCDKVTVVNSNCRVINLRWLAPLWFAILRRLK